MSKTRTNPKSSSGGAAASKPPAESIKETIDSIVIALVLALVFRAFIVEAFVIPTGSMATTLLGEHRQFVCHNCGFNFTVGYDPKVTDTATHFRHQLYCPNCTARFREDRQIFSEVNPVRGGDKILVFKFPYLFAEPARWDVVVFYNPANPDENFIKRLIGRPGESVQIIDGDIYVGGYPPSPAQRDVIANQMQVQRKPPLVQQALWRPVYLNDYFPRNRDPNQRGVTPMWLPTAGSVGWATDSRILSFRPAADHSAGAIEFVPAELPEHFRVPLCFTDYSGYNTLPDSIGLLNVVWDLKLEFVLFFQDAAGRLSVSMTHRATGDDPLATTLFTATFHQDGRVELLEDGQVLRTYQGSPFPIGQGTAIAVQNVDYLVSVLVGDQEVVSWPRQPTLAALRQLDRDRRIRSELDRARQTGRWATPRVDIEAEGGPLDLRHVSLYRDVYYTSRTEQVLRAAPETEEPIVYLARHSAEHQAHDEFFVLGDNSPLSQDSRMWSLATGPYPHLRRRPGPEYVAGRVPRDHLIGQAFFVYWPAGLGPRIPLPGRPGNEVQIVPNVGRMRMIH